MNHDPYQIIIMRPTGRRATMTIRALWVRVFFVGLALLVAALVALVLGLAASRQAGQQQAEVIARQNGELKELNIRLAHRNETIIDLRKKVSGAIRHQIHPLPAEIKLPKLHPPTCEIADLAFCGHDLTFKIVNLDSGAGQAASGHLYAVFRQDEDLTCHPAVPLIDGVPAVKDKGLAFNIRNYKPMRIKAIDEGWSSLTIYIFDTQGRMRLAYSVGRDRIQAAKE